MSTSYETFANQGETALAPRSNGFSDLENAESNTLLFVDTNGQAISSEKAKKTILQRATVMFIGSLFFLKVYALFVGIELGIICNALLLLFFALNWIFFSRIYKTAHLLQQGHSSEAEAKFSKLLPYAKFVKGSRFSIFRGMAIATMKQGDYVKSLQFIQQASQHKVKGRRGAVYHMLNQCLEVMILCNLGEFHLAKVQFSLIPEVPTGDYVRLQYWIARLYLEFCTNRGSLTEQEIWELSQMGLRINRSATLLALCAWNFQQFGKPEMASHLLKEVESRLLDFLTQQDFIHTVPLLWQWVTHQYSKKTKNLLR